MLKELAVGPGMEVAAVAHDAAAALKALQSESLAVLDVDLGNDTSLEVVAACPCASIGGCRRSDAEFVTFRLHCFDLSGRNHFAANLVFHALGEGRADVAERHVTSSCRKE